MKRRQNKQIESCQTKKAKIEARSNDPISLLKEFSTLLKNSEDKEEIKNLENLKILFKYIVSHDSGFKNHYTNLEGWKHTYGEQTCWRYFSTNSWAKTWAKTWARIIHFITQFYDQNPDTKVNDCKYCLGEKAGEFRVNIQELTDTCCFSQLKHSCIVHYGNVIIQKEDLCKDCKEIFKTNFMSKRKHLKKLSCQLAQQVAKNRLDLEALKKKQKQRMKELAEKMRQKEKPAKTQQETKKIVRTEYLRSEDKSALVNVVRLRQTMRLCQITWESSRFSPSLNILETVTKEYLGALMELSPGDTKQEEELLSVSRRFVELWRQITMTVGDQNMAPEAEYLVTLADMFMSSSPSSSLHQMPGYLVSLAAKSGSSDTSKRMEQRLAPQLSDRVRSVKVERCFIIKKMTQETKQFFIKDYFKRLILDSMNTAVNRVDISITEENVAKDANKLSEQTSSKAGSPVQVAAPAPAPAPVQLPVAVAPAPVQSAPLQQAPAPVHIAETAWINEDTFVHDDVEDGLTDPLGESANDDEEYYDEDDVNEEDEKDVEDEEFTQLADYGLLMDKDGKLHYIH